MIPTLRPKLGKANPRRMDMSLLMTRPTTHIFMQSKTPSLIFEYVNNTDFRSLYPKFVDFDVRYYILELLKVGIGVFV